MYFLQYLGVALVTSLSIPTGAFIARSTEEELKLGLRYLRGLELIFAFLAMFFAASSATDEIVLVIFIPVFVIIIAIFSAVFLHRQAKDYLLILAFSASFFLGLNAKNSYVVPSLIALYGLCLGAIDYSVFYLEKKSTRWVLQSIILKTVILLLAMPLVFLMF